MQLNRRSFFKGLASAAAIAVIPIDVASAFIGSPTNFAPRIRASYSDMVVAALHEARHQLMENVTANNTLLERLTRKAK